MVTEEVEGPVVEVRGEEDLDVGDHEERIPTLQEQEAAFGAADHSIKARRCGVPRVNVLGHVVCTQNMDAWIRHNNASIRESQIDDELSNQHFENGPSEWKKVNILRQA